MQFFTAIFMGSIHKLICIYKRIWEQIRKLLKKRNYLVI